VFALDLMSAYEGEHTIFETSFSRKKPGMVVCTCHPSYLGGIDGNIAI
jgi:hypothetical protein